MFSLMIMFDRDVRAFCTMMLAVPASPSNSMGLLSIVSRLILTKTRVREMGWEVKVDGKGEG